jgi:Bacterial regulatory proteins, luxR family
VAISENDEPLLWDFIYWVRKRRPDVLDALVSEETLEYVAQGIELFLKGEKNPWPQKRGMKQEPDTMWKCYHLTSFPVDKDGPHLPQHCDDGGAYKVVGDRLGISPKTVEYHTSRARKRLNTAEGVQEYQEWRNSLEKRWWCYHAVCVEQRELNLLEYVGKIQGDTLILTNGGVDTLRLTRKEVEANVDEAEELLEDARGKQDYKEWLGDYERRNEKGIDMNPSARPAFLRNCDNPTFRALSE